ncbi:MAG: DNA adenine methylase [Candidatus Melainabacteria bacterium]|nr:DNA adenine methylase [Candidatus Melainabacteria bacterium]
MRETVLKLHFLHYFLLLVILLSFSVVSAAEPNLEKIKSLSKPFSELLILDQGRYKPLDSYAKTKLLQFSGKTSIKLNLSENKTRAGESLVSKPVNKTEKISYMEWFTAAVFEPDLIYSAKLFLINNPEVLTAINVAVDSHRRYSYDELRESISTLNQLAAQAESKPEEKRSLVEKELIRVSNNFHEFTQIASSFSLFQRKPMLADLAKPELLIALGINEGDENAEISLFNIVGKASELEQIINSASVLKPDAVKLGFVLYSWIESYREYLNIFRREEVTAILANPLPKDAVVGQEGYLEFVNPWTYFYEIQSHLGRVAKRTSSRLRRTNDRSVLGVISSDAEHARQVLYASKRKYKLDLSSLHEDHEDDENAEIEVQQQCDILIYLDPPYYSATHSRLYGKKGNLHSSFDHQRFSEEMKACKMNWFISYDNSKFVRELFSFAKQHAWQLQYGMNNPNKDSCLMGEELIVSGF